MAPNRDAVAGTYKGKSNISNKPSRLPMENLQRTISDLSLELVKEAAVDTKLPPISKVEDAKCECCGMSEECTPNYIKQVRDRFSGKLICGLCAEAVTQEMEKNGGTREQALSEHMNACARFNRLGRAYPVLCQAEAMRKILKNSRTKSLSPRDKAGQKKGLSRSSSCFPAIIKENDNQEEFN